MTGCGWIEQQAELSPNLQSALRNLWARTLPDDARTRLDRAAGKQ